MAILDSGNFADAVSFSRAVVGGYTGSGDAVPFQREAAVDALRAAHLGNFVLLENEPVTPCILVAPDEDEISVELDFGDYTVEFPEIPVTASRLRYEYRRIVSGDTPAGGWTSNGTSTTITGTATTGDYYLQIRAVTTSGVAGEIAETEEFHLEARPLVAGMAVTAADASALIVSFDSACVFGAGGNGGLTISATGDAVTPSYASGSGTDEFIFTLSRPIGDSETLTASYTQPGNGIESTPGGVDLASFSNVAIVNSVGFPLVIDSDSVANGGSGNTVTLNSTGANVIFVARSCYAFATEPAIVDGNGNTYTDLTITGGFSRLRLAYCINPIVGSGHTINADGALAGLAAVAIKMKDPVFDAETVASAAYSPGSITPSEDVSVAVTAFVMDAVPAGTTGLDAPFTLLESQDRNGSSFGVFLGIKINANDDAVNPVWTWATGGSSPIDYHAAQAVVISTP